jgi:hypothetical protein
MVNDILDFPDTLREYANEMRSWLSYRILYTLKQWIHPQSFSLGSLF